MVAQLRAIALGYAGDRVGHEKAREYREYRMSLISHSALDLHVHNPDFIMADSAEKSGEELRRAFNQEKSMLLRKRLNGCCRGLAETFKGQHHGRDHSVEIEHEDSSFVLDLTHRSVPEFPRLANVQRRLKLLPLSGFDQWHAITSLLLVDLLFDKGRLWQTCHTMETLVNIIIHLGWVQPPYTFLERIRGLLAVHNKRLGEIERLSFSKILVDIGGMPSQSDNAKLRTRSQYLEHPDVVSSNDFQVRLLDR